MKNVNWYIYGIDYVMRKKVSSLYRIPYCKQARLSNIQANNMVYEDILSNKPFFAGRMGLFELAAMRAFEFKNEDKYDIVMKQIYDCAGFFPYDINLGNRFLREMKEALSDVDLLACSYNLDENYFINHCMHKASVVAESFDVMSPWKYELPWSSALQGKKVLVVNPFEASILEQYAKRELLFKGTDILPEFELLTYKSLQSTGDFKDDRFEDWFEALDFMYSEIEKLDYDIALLGCGAYGFPLGARIKRAGKQAIHMGGVLQLLFGIMGKRWDGTGPNSVEHQMEPGIGKFFNENWTYPKAEETPQHAKNIEYGPYWK